MTYRALSERIRRRLSARLQAPAQPCGRPAAAPRQTHDPDARGRPRGPDERSVAGEPRGGRRTGRPARRRRRSGLAAGGREPVRRARRVARPELSYLTLPSTATAGRPPRIVLELVEPHTASVYLRVLMIDLHSRRTVLTAQMGWVPTSHRFAVVWPHGAQLGAGTYRVTVSAHDRHNGNIIRNARISGEATITVTAPPVTPSPPRARSRRAHARADGRRRRRRSPCAGPTTSATPKTASARPAPGTSTRVRTC